MSRCTTEFVLDGTDVLLITASLNCEFRFVGGWPESDCCFPAADPAVIDCTCELPKTHNAKRYLCIPVWDTHGLFTTSP